MEKEYLTTNLYEASSLVASGIQLIRVDPGFGGRREFVFANNEDVNKTANDFVNAKLTLNIQTFIGAWRRLRRLVDANGDMRNGKSRR